MGSLYSQFAQEYIEVIDELEGLAHEIGDILLTGGTIPSDLKDEYKLYKENARKREEIGIQLYQKQPHELYKDGWDFWVKEDAELRANRYGR